MTTPAPTYTISARLYDLLSGMLQHWGTIKTVLHLSGVCPEDHVLDVCCGTGTYGLAFVEHCQQVSAVDNNNWMLQAARSKDRKQRMKIQKMDARQLTFADNAFDISLIAFTLHDLGITDRKTILSEMKRVTRKRVLIIDYHLPRPSWRQTVFLSLARLYDTPQMQTFVRCDLVNELSSIGLTVESKTLLRAGKIAVYVCAKN